MLLHEWGGSSSSRGRQKGRWFLPGRSPTRMYTLTRRLLTTPYSAPSPSHPALTAPSLRGPPATPPPLPLRCCCRSNAEVAALIEGVQECGVGKWEQVSAAPNGCACPRAGMLGSPELAARLPCPPGSRPARRRSVQGAAAVSVGRWAGAPRPACFPACPAPCVHPPLPPRAGAGGAP